MNLWSRVRHKGKRTGEMDQKTGGGSGSNYAPIDRRTSRLQTPATSHDDFDSRAPRSWKATEEAARPEKESPPRPANPADYINYGPFFLVIVAAASGREKDYAKCDTDKLVDKTSPPLSPTWKASPSRPPSCHRI
jgi:hypothetical protein